MVGNLQGASMSEPSELETEAQNACQRGDHAAAATLAVEGYGGEIMAFLLARLRSRSDAEEVFAAFAERLWVGLPQFEWRCSLRSWAYRIARNAATDFVSALHNRADRRLPLSQHEGLAELVDRVRSTTAVYRQTHAKDRMRELRETLAPDDQLLLILRVDRGMDFRELAAALGDHASTLEPDQLDREAARLRKRFERVKDQLRDLARADGLL